MPYVIIDGTGDYQAAGEKFRPGANEVSEETASKVLQDPELPRWVRVSNDRQPAPVAEAIANPPEPQYVPDPIDKAPGAPFAVYGGRDGKWYFNDANGQQSGPLADKDAAAVAAQEARDAADSAQAAARDAANAAQQAAVRKAEQAAAQGPPVPTADQVAAASKEAKPANAPSGTVCPQCQKSFDSEGQLDNHLRIAHPKEAQ